MSVFSVAVLQKGNTGNLICLASITKLYHQPANGHSWVEDWGWLKKNWITLFSTVHCQNSLHHQQHSEVVGNIVPACHTVPTAWEKAGVVKARRERLLLQALSGMACRDVSEAAWGVALVRFILIFADEPCWPWPGNHQPAPPHSAEPPSNERRADEQQEVSHCRTLEGYWQEAVTQSPRPLKQRQLKCLLSFSYDKIICVSSIFHTVQEVRP